MNRMQGALLEEAFRLVADEYTIVRDIDIGSREGLLPGWSFIEHLKTIDLSAPNGVHGLREPLSGNIRKYLFSISTAY